MHIIIFIAIIRVVVGVVTNHRFTSPQTVTPLPRPNCVFYWIFQKMEKRNSHSTVTHKLNEHEQWTQRQRHQTNIFARTESERNCLIWIYVCSARGPVGFILCRETQSNNKWTTNEPSNARINMPTAVDSMLYVTSIFELHTSLIRHNA